MDKFVARENIRHFRDRLETETDPIARSLLHRLLIQELDKLGHNSEALRVVENHITGVNEQVKRQQALVASTEQDGYDTGQALVLLNAYSDILLAFKNQRQKILINL